MSTPNSQLGVATVSTLPSYTNPFSYNLIMHRINALYRTIMETEIIVNSQRNIPVGKQELLNTALIATLVHATRDVDEIVENLILRGANVHANNNYPLTISCEKGFVKSVNVLLRYGVDVNFSKQEPLSHEMSYFFDIEPLDDDFDKPLTRAAEFGHYDIVYMLLKHGADDVEYALKLAESNKHTHIVKLIKNFLYNNEQQFIRSIRSHLEPVR